MILTVVMIEVRVDGYGFLEFVKTGVLFLFDGVDELGHWWGVKANERRLDVMKRCITFYSVWMAPIWASHTSSSLVSFQYSHTSI